VTWGRVTGRQPSGHRLLANQSVKIKVLLPVGLAVLGIVAVGVIGTIAVGTTAATARTMYAHSALPLADLGRIRDAEGDARVLIRDRTTAVTPAAVKVVDLAIGRTDKDMDAAMAAYVADRSPAESSTSKSLFDQFKSDWASWKNVRDTVVLRLANEGLNIDAQARTSTVLAQADDAYSIPLDTLVQRETQTALTSAMRAKSLAQHAQTRIIAVSIGAALLALLIGILVARAIARPIRRVRDVLVTVADGDLTGSADIGGTDELGVMAGALDSAVRNMRDAVKTMADSSQALGDSSTRIGGYAARIATVAERASTRAGTAAAAAEQVSASVQTVAAGAEEMSASISEIASNAHKVAQVATLATARAQQTNQTIAGLGRSSAAIGDVIKVIASIAQQTNLLALNATIEAARAGEAGKGFAVVASEVKELAQEAAKASEDITRRIETIQNDADVAVAAIGEIAQTIAHISDFQTTIASAVEEQTSTTLDMARNVSHAAGGADEIAGAIADVAQAAEATTNDAVESNNAAAELAKLSRDLESAVGKFRH
jgi:methyl-accepting chemotaxis protein